ncbi:hypothetical protein M405DRAFT_834491 [Rhizopogon salebrosus TDB-379]|nr:hypothetical protein M405DRAFT_834491 [Rhizopogon salebrosus TDB-379]
MGYLKGTWESLRGLRVRLDNEDHVQYASLWIVTCIHLHAFTLGHQKGILAEEAQRDAELQEAMEQRVNLEEQGKEESWDITLLEGKLKREELKKSLFEYIYSQN